MSDGNLAEDLNLEESMAETLAEIQANDEEFNNIYEHEPESEGEGEESSEERSARKRDERGRFASEEEISEEDESEEITEVPETVIAPETTAKSEEGEQELQQEHEIDPRLEKPPTTWRTEAKLKWDSIEPGVKEEILKREEDIGRGITHYKQMADYGDAVQQTVQPYMPMITAAGSTPQQTIGAMLDTFYRLKTSDPQQKSQLLMQVAQQHGADMTVFQNGIDPGQVEMQTQLQPLQSQISYLQQQIQQRDEQTQQFESAQAINDITAFSNAVDESTGKALYPYFDIVRNQMADLIESNERAGIKTSLNDAYENAIWQTPEIRQKLLSEQSLNAESQRQSSVAEKTRKAKRANKVNLQTRGSYDEKTVKPTGTLNDTMEDILQDIKSRS